MNKKQNIVVALLTLASSPLMSCSAHAIDKQQSQVTPIQAAQEIRRNEVIIKLHKILMQDAVDTIYSATIINKSPSYIQLSAHLIRAKDQKGHIYRLTLTGVELETQLKPYESLETIMGFDMTKGNTIIDAFFVKP